MHVWYVYCQLYYLLYMKSILFLKLKIIFMLFLYAQFESNTVCPRSLGPIYILGRYEKKTEIAIRNVSRVCWKIRKKKKKIKIKNHSHIFIYMKEQYLKIILFFLIIWDFEPVILVIQKPNLCQWTTKAFYNISV